jgi:hypothetical protein
MSVTINASTSTGLVQTADTSGTIEIQSNGTTKFTVASTGAYGQITSGTAVASTSGTSIDFTGIPSWVKRITVMWSGVSTSGSSQPQIQIGSGSVSTSGYTCYQSYAGATNAAGGGVITSGFSIQSGNAVNILYGTFVLTLLTGNTWMCIANFGLNSSSVYYGMFSSGTSPALSGALDRVRMTTVNGTDTFDAGTINILYEG